MNVTYDRKKTINYKQMKQIYILVITLSLTLVKVNAQNTEDFETYTFYFAARTIKQLL